MSPREMPRETSAEASRRHRRCVWDQVKTVSWYTTEGQSPKTVAARSRKPSSVSGHKFAGFAPRLPMPWDDHLACKLKAIKLLWVGSLNH